MCIISKPLTNWPQSLLVVFLVKPHPFLYLSSMGLLATGIMTSLLLACHSSIGRALHWHCSLRSGFESHPGLSCYYKSGIVWFQKISIPPPRKTIGNSEGGEEFKGSNFRRVGGFRGKLLFQRVTNHVTNIERNIRSIWSAKTCLRTFFWNKSQYSWPLR